MIRNNTNLSDALFLAERTQKYIKKQQRHNILAVLCVLGIGYFLESQIENIDRRLRTIEEEMEGLKYEED